MDSHRGEKVAVVRDLPRQRGGSSHGFRFVLGLELVQLVFGFLHPREVGFVKLRRWGVRQVGVSFVVRLRSKLETRRRAGVRLGAVMVRSQGCSRTMARLRVAARVRRVAVGGASSSVTSLSLTVTRFDIGFRSGFSAGSFGAPAHRQLGKRCGGVLVRVGSVVVSRQRSRVSSDALVSLDGARRRLCSSMVLVLSLRSVSRGGRVGVCVSSS